jgi:hypothetical protein
MAENRLVAEQSTPERSARADVGYWLRRVGLPVLAFLPAIALLGWITEFAVNVPYWDDWERGVLLQKLEEGSLTIKDLNAPHIDHRMLFPRILMIGLNEVSGGDLRWEMACSWLFAVVAALGLVGLARATVFERGMNWGVIFAVNLVVFSPMQWDNWLWGIQIAFMLPMACLIWAIWVVLKPWVWWKRWGICVILAIVATHSFGHGFVVWPAVFGLVLLRGDLGLSAGQRAAFLLGWLVVGSGVIGNYLLVDFVNASHHSHSYGQAVGDVPPSAKHAAGLASKLPVIADYLCVLAGNAFARLHLVDPLKLTYRVGLILLGTFGVLGLWVVWQGIKKRPVWERALPWLAVGFSALLGMTAVAAGRSSLIGLSRATSSRYSSISLYMAVALIFLLVLWFRHARFWSRWSVAGRSQVGMMSVALFAGYSVPLWNYGVQMMGLCHDARLQAKAALQFIRFWDPEQLSRLDGDVTFLRRMAEILDGQGLLSPPLRKELALDEFKVSEAARSKGQAKVERIEAVGGGRFEVAGYAKIGDRAADGVLLTWEVADRRPMIFGMAEPTSQMVSQLYPGELEMVGRERPGIWDFCKWRKTFRVEDIKGFDEVGVEQVVVKCWLFDVQKLHAYRIKGELRVSRNGGHEVRDE